MDLGQAREGAGAQAPGQKYQQGRKGSPGDRGDVLWLSPGLTGNKRSSSQDAAGNRSVRTCHLAELCLADRAGRLLPTCKDPRLLSSPPGLLLPARPQDRIPEGSNKQEDYQRDVSSQRLGVSQGQRRKLLAVKRKGKSDVPVLGQLSEDSVLHKYLLNESVYVCQTPGTEMKDSTLPSQYL